jgi:hypothetical protein
MVRMWKEILNVWGLLIDKEWKVFLEERKETRWFPKWHKRRSEMITDAIRRILREKTWIPDTNLRFIKNLWNYKRHKLWDKELEVKNIYIFSFETNKSVKEWSTLKAFSIEEAEELLRYDEDKIFFRKVKDNLYYKKKISKNKKWSKTSKKSLTLKAI